MCRFGDCHRLAEWFYNSSDICCGTRTPSRPLQSLEWVKGGGPGGEGGGGTKVSNCESDTDIASLTPSHLQAMI